jgi:hypothetical protein
MKKTALVLVLTIIALVGNQNLFASDIRLGLKASPSLAWFKPDTDGYNSEGIRPGFSYGLITEFALAEHYSFATGAHVTYLGGKLSYPWIEGNDSGEKTRTYRLQNLEIPLTIKMKTREIGYNTYFALFGFGSSLNLSAKANDKFITQNTSIEQSSVDIKSDIPFLRVSLIMGLGVEYSLGGNTSISAGLTFNNGFTNILKGENPVNNRKQNAKANFLELSVGLLF